MKRLYLIILLANALVINLSAQKQWCNLNYTVDSILYAPVVPFDSGTQIPLGRDSFSTVIPIGFNFDFYGTNFSSVVISSMGYLTFDTTEASTAAPFLNPNSVYLFEQPLFVGSPAINYTMLGTAPNRMFVVSYDSIEASNGAFFGTFNTGQIILYETSNNIEMHILYTYPATGYMLQALANEGVVGTTGPSAAPLPDSLSTGRAGRNDQFWSATNDGVRFTPFNAPAPAPSICMVSVDSASGKNVVIWDKSNVGLSVDSFIIYKETNVSGVYSQIGIQPYSTFSTFIDMGSNPGQQANRYKIGFVDSCGVVSLQSAPHKTIHLSINKGIGNTWNLIWDAYQGFNYGSFNLYRGTSPTDMSLLTTITGTLYSYTDNTPPVGQVYYVIGVDNPDPCTPARIAGGGSLSSSISNIVNNQVLSFQSFFDESSVSIFPNPSNDKLVIHFSSKSINENITVSFLNVLGETVKQEELKWTDDANIDIKTLSTGVYFLQIKSESGSVVKKFVKE